MAFGRVTAPVQNKVGSVFNFTQRTRYFSAQLSGNFGRTVSQRRVTVQQTTKLVSQSHTLLLCLASRVAHAIHQRHVRLMKTLSRHLDGFVDRRFFAVDQRIGVFTFGGMVQEPSRAEHAGPFGFVNAEFVRVKFNIITNTTTKSTSCVGDHFE